MTTPRPEQHDYYTSEAINFDELAQGDADFNIVYKSHAGKLDWQDSKTLQALTKALLKRDFGLTLSLRDDRLCPPVPVRFNYIRWLQELIDTTSEDLKDSYDPARKVIGYDIGTGATCIYPLLACASRPRWNMIATDIDTVSLDSAKQNIDANQLANRIKLFKNEPEAPLLRNEVVTALNIDFVMCNPPFYASQEDMDDGYKGKVLKPSAVCTGSSNEMICKGGDIGFAMRILEESLVHKEEIQWYSCMLGRLKSAKELVISIKEHGITNFAVTNLQAGDKTVRWAVAWSFQNYRPRNDVTRHGSLVTAMLALPTERTIEVPGMAAKALGTKIDNIMSDLDLEWDYNPVGYSGVMAADGNVWSRSARRKKAKGQVKMQLDGDSSGEEDNITLAVKLQCRDGSIQVRWYRGNDTVLFESFIGMVRNAMGMRRNL